MSYHLNVTIDPEDRDQYRQYVASLDMPIHEIDAVIDIVLSIMGHFVDTAFHVQTDQITLGSISKIGFNAQRGHVMIENPKNQTAAAESYGVEGDSNP